MATTTNAVSPEPGPPDSPCVGICQLDDKQLCTGCGRTLGEIAEWSSASDRRRWQIRDAAAERLSIIAARFPDSGSAPQ
jgi:predicted Fe-S protein YdhL (DUF1289 family)